MIKTTDYCRDRLDIDEVNKKVSQVYVCRACGDKSCEKMVNLCNGDNDVINEECPYGVRVGTEVKKRKPKFTFEPRQDQQKFDDDEMFTPRPKKRR
jgi:ribosomal protein L37AE/L43A